MFDNYIHLFADNAYIKMSFTTEYVTGKKLVEKVFIIILLCCVEIKFV